jgi:hypothetical protein
MLQVSLSRNCVTQHSNAAREPQTETALRKQHLHQVLIERALWTFRAYV